MKLHLKYALRVSGKSNHLLLAEVKMSARKGHFRIDTIFTHLPLARQINYTPAIVFKYFTHFKWPRDDGHLTFSKDQRDERNTEEALMLAG